jgi:6-pyruvoyltetrahydropterin/6-carboxytetrahydropterin synthase
MSTIVVACELEFDAAHRLLGHPGRCASLHGHRYRVEVRVAGGPGEDGLVLDFSDLKGRLRGLLDPWDHATLLQEGDPLLPVLRADPTCRVVACPWPPTAERMAEAVHGSLARSLPPDLAVAAVTVWETPTSSATAA